MFKLPEIYEEKHGLDSPPYERVAVCPKCCCSDFYEFDTLIEKIEITEKLIPALAALNRYEDSLADIFGLKVENDNLAEAVGLITELICEMYSFMDVSSQRKLLELNTEKDIGNILLYFKGEL